MQISTPPLAPAGETGPSVKGHARSGGRAEIAVCDASRSDQVHIALVVRAFHRDFVELVTGQSGTMRHDMKLVTGKPMVGRAVTGPA